jgi:hypothetical protein
MARERKKWYGFFNYALTDSERSAIKALQAKNPSSKVGQWVSTLCSYGYKVSVSFDQEDSIFVCAATGGKESKNEGWSLVIQHVDLAIAVCAACFVAEDVFNWEKWPTDSGSRPDVNW